MTGSETEGRFTGFGVKHSCSPFQWPKEPEQCFWKTKWWMQEKKRSKKIVVVITWLFTNITATCKAYLWGRSVQIIVYAVTLTLMLSYISPRLDPVWLSTWQAVNRVPILKSLVWLDWGKLGSIPRSRGYLRVRWYGIWVLCCFFFLTA